MLDQNTDRMWYVIGAIVIGAAIIAMGLNIFNESFDSVDSMMASLTDIASENVFSIGNDGIYTEEEIDNLINNEGYIPVATVDELDDIRKSESQTFGLNSKWESEYTTGLDKKYIQVSNIDLSSIDNWNPIGHRGSEFTGTFDGAGYKVSNLTVDREIYVGLFGYASGAIFNNVGLVNVDAKGKSYIGGLVGWQNRASRISDSYSTGVFSGIHAVGGLVGEQQGASKTTNSYSTGVVSGERYIGGLIGYQRGHSTVTTSYSTVDVMGDTHVGGLIGRQDLSSKITTSYATGDVSSTGSYVSVGGFLGSSHDSQVFDSGWLDRVDVNGIGADSGTTSNFISLDKSEIENVISNLTD